MLGFQGGYQPYRRGGAGRCPLPVCLGNVRLPYKQLVDSPPVVFLPLLRQSSTRAWRPRRQRSWQSRLGYRGYLHLLANLPKGLFFGFQVVAASLSRPLSHARAKTTAVDKQICLSGSSCTLLALASLLVPSHTPTLFLAMAAGRRCWGAYR